jgi:hypothetical protein
MKEYIKHPIVITGLISIAVGLMCIIVTKTCTHEVAHIGTVISHNITSDKYGDITYYTVARFDDGYRSLEGLKYYVIKVGDKVYYTDRVWN